MNCMEFQRRLNADPRRLSALALGHAETCVDCARRLAGQIKLDARLDTGLQVPPPAGMEDRILLATRLDGQKRQRDYVWAAALLAGVALGLGVLASSHDTRPVDLADMSIAHVLSEPAHLHETQRVDRAMLNHLLARAGAQSRGALPVTYAGACPLPNGEGAHIVLNLQHGRVTLMLIPNGKTDTMLRRTTARFVVEVHAARHGSYSLVAPNESALIEAKALLARQLRWA